MNVSIIIPVYNVQNYIQKCLDSVASQTYTGEMECLLIDDCGQDDSISVAEQFITNYHGSISFRIIHHDNNKGLSGARNTGIQEAKGDWLYFLDSDDWIIPECIQLMWECVEKYPNTECVFAGAKSTDPVRDGWMSIENRQSLPAYSDDPAWIKKTMLQRFPLAMTAWNRLIRKNLVLSKELFFVDGMIHEDEAWNFLLAKHLRYIAVCKKDTYRYLRRNDSITSQLIKDLDLEFRSYSQCFSYEISTIDGIMREEQVCSIWKCINAYRTSVRKRTRYRIRFVLLRLACHARGILTLVILWNALAPYRFRFKGYFGHLAYQYLGNS